MIRFLRQFDPHTIRLLIFDLDGTLVDSRLDLIQSINAMLRHFSRPELPGDLIATYVGDGAPTLVRRALGDAGDEQLFKSALEYFLAYYRIHKLDHTTVYAGIPEALARIAASPCGAGLPARQSTEALIDSSSRSLQPSQPDLGPPLDADIRADRLALSKAEGSARPTQASRRLMAVLSNKPVNPSRDIIRALGLGDFFVCVYGGNSFATKKPDPQGVQTILEETGVAASEAMIVGDSSIDVLTGRNAGLWICGVTYGFAPHTLKDLPPDVVVESPSELAELFE